MTPAKTPTQKKAKRTYVLDAKILDRFEAVVPPGKGGAFIDEALTIWMENKKREALRARVLEGLADEETPLLNLIRETKSSLKADDLRIAEERKIQCGKAHFEKALQVPFKKITQASEILP